MTATSRSILLFSLILLGSCASAPSRSPSAVAGFEETGIASFYAMKYQFRKTASGERLNQFADTAAHESLPFGSRVKVTNVNNGDSVIVKINDRGPFIEGRIIDLTRSAFAKIGDTGLGLIDVKIEVVN